MQRAYCPEYKIQHPTYEDVVVCESWHNYQNFAEWITGQIGFGRMGYNLDKDRLVKGNKIYAPEFCVLIPQELNKLVAYQCSEGRSSPVGTSTRPDLNGQYMARLSKHGSLQGEAYLGLIDTAELAFAAYKREKEAYIRERETFGNPPSIHELRCTYELHSRNYRLMGLTTLNKCLTMSLLHNKHT